MESKKSPLKTKLRRAAGQSLQEELNKLRDIYVEKGLLATVAIVFPLGELSRWLLKAQPNPIEAAIVCVPLFLYAVYQMRGLRSEIKDLKLGLEGEKIVGEKLENLRAHGYRIFHDLIGNHFNVDHVLVGPAGVFSVDTKTWSRRKGDEIENDGESLWKNGLQLDPNPIDQAKAQARWLHGLIKELTNESVFVQPIIVFPGWWVEAKVPEPKVLVFNPDQVEGYLKSRPMRLEQKDIGFIASRLEFLARESNP